MNDNHNITASDRLTNLFPPLPESSVVAVILRPADYSASIISRAVEDCGAHLLNLNVTGERTPEGDMIVYLRVDMLNAGPVCRSLERFGFSAIPLESDMSSADSERARDRAREILRYLEI